MGRPLQPETAALEALWPSLLWAAIRPAIEDRLTIEPGWLARRYLSACLVPRNTESTLTLMTSFHSSKLRVSISPPREMPALLTRTLIPPIAASASSRAKIHCASSRTSSGKAKAVPAPHRASISLATAWAPSRLRSARAILAPSSASRRAAAAPSP